MEPPLVLAADPPPVLLGEGAAEKPGDEKGEGDGSGTYK